MKPHAAYIPIPEVTWDAIEVNKRVDALKGNWDGVDPYSIYPQAAFDMLSNKVLKARWTFNVVATFTYRRGVEDYCITCELFYKIEEAMLFKEGAALLTDQLSFDFIVPFPKKPDSVVITANGLIKVPTGFNKRRK